MLETIAVILIGLAGGVAVGIQAQVAGGMSSRIGGAAGSVVVHLGGLIFSTLLLLLRGGERIREWNTLPWYMLGSGIFGLILYLTISVTLPRLGGTWMISLIIIGQLLVGVLVDHFGWFGAALQPLSPSRLLGVLVLLLGGFLISR